MDVVVYVGISEITWCDDVELLSVQTLHEALEVVFAGTNVHCDCFLFDVWVWADDHDVSGRGELIDKADELLVTDDHRLELVVGLDTTELELFDNVWNFLKAMVIFVVRSIEVGDH